MGTVHVMHVLGDFGPGGAEMGVVRLISSFPDRDVRHSVCSIGRDVTMKSQLPPGVACHTMGCEGPDRAVFWRLRRLLRAEDVDVAHVSNLAPWFDVALGARLAGCRVIETFHGVEEGTPSLPLAKRMLLRLAAAVTSDITAVAPAAADLVSALTGLRRGEIRVILNGVDTDLFRPCGSEPERAALRNELGLPSQGCLFGCVAGLRAVKNHVGLLHAFDGALSEESWPDGPPTLILVGDGPLRGDLESQTDELGLAQRVRFLGRRDDVPELLRAFDAFVLGSHTEGLSYAVLEAMASALPVIATAVGANPDLIETGEQGLLVPVGDAPALASALCRVARDSRQRKGMGQAARTRVTCRYSLAESLKEYAELYRAVGAAR